MRSRTRAWRGAIGVVAVLGVLAAGTSCVSPGIPCNGVLENQGDAMKEFNTKLTIGLGAWEMLPLAERVDLWFWLIWAMSQPRWAPGDVQPYSPSQDLECSSTVWEAREIPATATPTTAPASSPPTTVLGPPITFTYLHPGTGPTTGGSSIMIVGSGFTGVTSVTFGGVPGTGIVVQDDNHLVVTTPAHAGGTVEIGITKPGRSLAVPGQFAYA